MLDVRPLKRKEIKELRKKGINLLSIQNIEGEKVDEVIDVVLDLVFPSKEEQKELDELPYSECMNLWRKIIEKTFGSEEVEKN